MTSSIIVARGAMLPIRVRSSVRLEPVTRRLAKGALAGVGPIVDALYPRGLDKLAARMEDALDLRARCTVAVAGRQVVGLAMESPKGSHRVKLSTLWVAPEWRNAGIGKALVANAVERWLKDGVETAHLTVCVQDCPLLNAALDPFGFTPIALEVDRYGDGRDEVVLGWDASMAPDGTWINFYAERWPRLSSPGRLAPTLL